MDVVIVLTPKFTTVVLPSIARIEAVVVEVDDEEVEEVDEEVEEVDEDEEEEVDEDEEEVLVVVVVEPAGLMASTITPKSLLWALPNDRVAPDIGLVRDSY
jgi:hypothetical protein